MSFILSEEYNPVTRQSLPGQHVCIRAGSNKTCIMCSVVGNRTKISREVRKSYFKCDTCDVFLCKGSTDCFSYYHELMKEVDFEYMLDRKMIKQVLTVNYRNWCRSNGVRDEIDNNI